MYVVPAEFDPNWQNKTDEEISNNISALNKHRKKYNMFFAEDSRLKIEHDFTDLSVNIVFYPIEQKGCVVNVANVNGKIVRSDKNPELYAAIKDLYYNCKHDQESLKLKIKKTIKKNKDKIEHSAIMTGVYILCMGIAVFLINYETKKEAEKQIKAKQEKADFAREILKVYETERAKGAVNIDSLINQHIK